VLWEHEVPGSNPGAPILVVRYLHLLAMATFVGGQLVLAGCVVPALRNDRPALRAVARRFGWATLIALGVLVVTGASMASTYDLWDDGTLHIKLGCVALVGVLIVWHLRQGAAHWLQGAIFLVSLVIVWLGLALAH
jgi:putative copper export protein